MIAIRCMQWGLAAVIGGVMACAQAEEPKVNIYNWYDFIAPTTLKDFQAQTGIQSAYDVFDNSEVMQSKLMAGRSGYDVVVATGDLLPNLIKAGVLKELIAPNCRTCPIWTRTSSPRSTATTPAIALPCLICGAPRALATTWPKSRRCWAMTHR